MVHLGANCSSTNKVCGECGGASGRIYPIKLQRVRDTRSRKFAGSVKLELFSRGGYAVRILTEEYIHQQPNVKLGLLLTGWALVLEASWFNRISASVSGAGSAQTMETPTKSTNQIVPASSPPHSKLASYKGGTFVLSWTANQLKSDYPEVSPILCFGVSRH